MLCTVASVGGSLARSPTLQLHPLAYVPLTCAPPLPSPPPRRRPLFPTYPVPHNPRLTTPARSLSRAFARALRAHSLSLSISRSLVCTMYSARHPLASYRKRPRIRILLRAFYVHRTGRVYVLTVYICIIQCSRERYSGFVEELAVGQRTLATQAESKCVYVHEREEGGGYICLCAYPPANV